MYRSFKLLVAIFLPLFLMACAGSPNDPERTGLFEADSRGGILGSDSSTGPSSSFTEIYEFAGRYLQVTKFDIPIVKNSRVEFWVEYFTGRGRRTFGRYIERLGKMKPLMEPMLVEANMPKDLVYLAMIESGFSPKARSRAGAVGPWQFIPATGRSYGLEQDWWYDERRDPVKSTKAAIRYLSVLYEEFDDWKLAAAAYNAGEGRIRWGIRKYGTRDYWELARHRAIRRETVDYVPKMMAAAIISKNPEVFGFKPPVWDSSWLETTTITLKGPEAIYSLANAGEITRKMLRTLNPELKRWSTPPVQNYALRVPSEAVRKRLEFAMTTGKIGKFRNFARYRVRRGDTLSQIASRFQVGIRPIMRLNNLASARRIWPGQMLIMPVMRGATPKKPHVRRQATTRIPAEFRNKLHVLYVVKKGDTLYDISRKYAVTVGELKRWNSISKHRKIRPGKTLRLYVKNDQPRI